MVPLWLALFIMQQPPPAAGQEELRLDIRVFNGVEEVTQEAVVTVYPQGRRDAALTPTYDPRRGQTLQVAPGLYDVRAVRQRDGAMLNIKWAEGLLVVRYPDEGGEHLQVINFRPGFGALLVRRAGTDSTAAPPPVGLYTASTHASQIGKALPGAGYALFVVPAGRYDLHVRDAGTGNWVPDVEVPLDRTRLKQVP
jgi:hypothetical protein